MSGTAEDDAPEAPAPHVLTLAVVRAALMRCMDAEPPDDKAIISKDTSLLTDISETMWYAKEFEVLVSSLPEKHQAALHRWMPETEG